MKKIEFLVNPEKLNLIKNRLKKKGVSGMTIVEARWLGDKGGHREIFRGIEYRVDYIPKAKIEIVAEERDVDSIVDVIIDICQREEEIDGGNIYIYPIEEVVRMRTKEKGRRAI